MQLFVSVVQSRDCQRTGEEEGQKCNVETSHLDCLFVCLFGGCCFYRYIFELLAYVLCCKDAGNCKSSLPGLFNESIE